MKELILEKIKKIHFIGIGGIGISAIARMMLLNGKKISGSDESLSEITGELSKSGSKIFDGHNADNLDGDADLVVYTIAISKNNPELEKAKRLGIPTLAYPQMIGFISKDYYTVAISGTHGKTTTTGMIAQIAIDAGLDPTVIIGSVLKNGKNSNFVAGKSRLLIVEACEYRRSFLNLNPNVLVITNIDEDHLDYYKDLVDIQSAFSELASKLGEDNFLVCNLSDERVAPAIKNTECEIIDYSLGSLTPKLKVPGEYNVENAKAALAVAKILKIKEQDALSSLERFEGVWRRFEYRGKTKNGAEVYDDYAHHPTEIRAALAAAREKFPEKKIIAAFQPHLYSRTKFFLDDFSESFSDADEVLIAPIYAAREKKDARISSQMLVGRIIKNGQNARFFGNFDEIEAHLKNRAKETDFIMTIGAGDIYKVGKNIVTE